MGYLCRNGFYVDSDLVEYDSQFGMFVDKKSREPADEINKKYREYKDKMELTHEFNPFFGRYGTWIKKQR